MPEPILWYLGLLLVGGGGLLPATLLFSRLRSGGVLYARPLALLLVAQATWLAAALTAIPYGTALVVAAVAGLYGWSAWLGWRGPERLRLLWSRRGTLLAGEALFLAVFALVLLVRAQAPAAIATEKPMDLALLTAVHEAESLPPADPWLAGFEVSYYHLGHTMVDASGRLAGVGPELGFNLGLAAVGALAAVAMAGLASDAVAIGYPRRRATVWIAAALAVLGLIWLAPFEGLAELAAANGLGGEGLWGRLGVNGLPGPAEATDGVPDQFWWWWRATRVLPGTIAEFPAFSLVLGDLHAHVLALPLGIVATALALETFEGGTALTWRRWLAQPGALLLAGALFAGLAMTNAWDVLTYGLIWLAAAVVSFSAVGWPLLGALFGAARYLTLPTLAGLAIAWPLLGTLDSSSVGAALVSDEASDPARLLLFWGPLLLPLAVAAAIARPRASRRALGRGLLLAALPVGVWAAWAVGSGEGAALADRGGGWLTLLGLVAAVGAAGAAAASAYVEGSRDRASWLALATAAGAIVLATELFHISDALGLGRLNSVFKFWYAAWPLLAAAGAVGLAQAYDRAPRPLLASLRASLASPRSPAAPAVAAFATVAALLWLGSLLYAPAAAISRGREGQERGLDALAYLDRSDAGAAEVLRWVRSELDGDRHTLLEAVSRSYGPGNVLSAASGVPTLLGWPGHELQWHSDAPLAARQQLVDEIYGGGAGPEALALARERGVTHVYLGREERRQYGPEVAERFAGWVTVFEAAGARIVAVPVEGVTTQERGQ